VFILPTFECFLAKRQFQAARFEEFLKYGRPGGTRTPNLRFWRPLLYQLSYWPKNTATFSLQSIMALRRKTDSAMSQ
jgi:hypothetical protein